MNTGIMDPINCDERKSNSDVGQKLVQHQKPPTAPDAKQKQSAAVDMHKKALKCGKCGYTQKMSENVFYLVALLGLLNALRPPEERSSAQLLGCSLRCLQLSFLSGSTDQYDRIQQRKLGYQVQSYLIYGLCSMRIL